MATGSHRPFGRIRERQKWVKAEWKVSESGQRAKYYKLTAAGKKQLVSERTRWDQVVSAIAGVLNPRAKAV
jgi:PadR family transcriptional regulator, regulatory protein PadR